MQTSRHAVFVLSNNGRLLNWNPGMHSEELMVAQEAARAGGEIVARYFRDGVVMRSKESYNLVSDADVESEDHHL